METYPAKVHTAFKLLLVCLFGTFYLPAVLAQQTGKAFFISEVDTAFHQIYVGKEVQLRYLSNWEMEKYTPPVWDAEEVERISGPHPMSSSRMTMVNGNSEIVSLQGFYFAIRFLKPGTVTLPAITAVIEGNTYTCASAVVNVLPAKNSEGVVCTFTTEPATPKAGQEFKLILVCNREPDPRTPAFQHPGIKQLSSSNMYSSQNGVEEYRFVYRMKAERPGSYVITPLDLTFGGVEYPLNTYPLDIESSNYLWVFVIFFLFAGVLINYWMQFRKERNEGLAAFVMRTGRMNLSVDNALTHYGLSVFMLFIPFIITGITIYKCLRGTPVFFETPFLLGIVVIPTLLFVLFSYVQYRKLFFEKVETKLSLDELYEVIQKLGAREEWSYEHAGDDCFVGHTSPGFFSGSWGEQIFVVFDKGQVWINSICDLNRRASVTSFGRTKKNIRMLKKAIAEAGG